MSRKSRLAITAAAAALAVVLVYVLFGATHRPVPVGTVTLKRGDLEVTVSATTTSTIKSEREVTLSARRMGTIARLPVEEGDAVEAGTLIAELDKGDVMAGLDKAKADLLVAEGQLARSEAGVAMLGSQAGSAVAESKSVLVEAKKDLARFKELFERGMVSRQEVDKAQRAYDVAAARHDKAVAGLDAVAVKSREVEAARAVVEQARSAVEVVKVQLGYSYIKAPVSGVISVLHVDLGETVAPGSPVAEIVDPGDIYVQSTIDEVDVSRLRVGMPVKIYVDALPGRMYDGEITRISPVVFGAKQETRTFEVRVRFVDRPGFIKPGMSADIEVLSRQLDDVLYVPAQAVMDREGGKYVYRLDGNKARLVPVEVGYFSWSDAEITSGLADGDEVVTTPDATGLEDGSRVTRKK